MSDAQIQAIKDVIKMIPRLNEDSLNSIKVLMEQAINSELLTLEPTIILENMDITEKVMYLDYLKESKDTKENELKNAISFEELLQKEGLTLNNLQNVSQGRRFLTQIGVYIFNVILNRCFKIGRSKGIIL